MKTDQNLQIDELNTILTEEIKKIVKLIQDVGDDDGGLIKRLNDLEFRVKTLEDITPSVKKFGDDL